MFHSFLPYDGREDSAVTEVHIGHNLIGDNLDTDVVNCRLNLLNQHVLPAVAGAYELTKRVLRELHNCPEKQKFVISFTKDLVKKLLEDSVYTAESVRTELADLNNHQAQCPTLSDEDLKRVEDTFTSREVEWDEGLQITGFLSAISAALKNYHNDDAPRTFGAAA